MARIIACDIEGCGRDAIMLVTELETGDTSGWCAEHWVQMILSNTQALGYALVDTTAPDPQSDGPTAEQVEQADNVTALMREWEGAEAPREYIQDPIPTEPPRKRKTVK